MIRYSQSMSKIAAVIMTGVVLLHAPCAFAQQETPDRPAAQRQRERALLGDDLEFVRDVKYATIEREGAESIELLMNVMFLKDNGDKIMPVVIYIHGGGYSQGSKDDGTVLLPPLARGGYCAISIGYRLSDVAPWPGAAHDCKAAVRFVRAHAEELGIDPQRIGVWGHPAGGHLAALLGVAGNAPVLEGNIGTVGVSSSVQCAVDISGPSDFTKLDRSTPIQAHILDSFFAGTEDTLHERLTAASTTKHVDAKDPPMLIVHGTNDNIVSIRHSEALLVELKRAGVEHEYIPVEGAGHSITEPRVYQAIAAFFDKQLGGHCAEFLRPAGAADGATN